MQPLDEIYREYAGYVYHYLCALTGSEELAEELTQDTFVEAVKNAHKFEGRASVSTWLCGIAKNRLRVWQRKHPPTAELTEEILTDTAPSAESEAISAEARGALYKRLHALSEPYREVLYLRLFAGLSYKEIADVFGKTENWARVTFYRGKEKLKEQENDEE